MVCLYIINLMQLVSTYEIQLLELTFFLFLPESDPNNGWSRWFHPQSSLSKPVIPHPYVTIQPSPAQPGPTQQQISLHLARLFTANRPSYLCFPRLFPSYPFIFTQESKTENQYTQELTEYLASIWNFS